MYVQTSKYETIMCSSTQTDKNRIWLHMIAS